MAVLRAVLCGLAALVCYAQGVVAVYPAPTSVTKGTARQFTTYVSVSPDTVSWSVNGTVGGDATYGTITETGLYQAPNDIPVANVVRVRATSVAKPNIFGESVLTIAQPTPWVWSTYPSVFGTGSNQTIYLNGAGFVPTSAVMVNGAPWTTTFVNSTTLSAIGNLAQPGSFAVTVKQPDPGSLTSQPVMITVNGAPAQSISITASPTTATVGLSGTVQFSATVKGTSNTGVMWAATAGTISTAGLFTAPPTMPAGSAITVRATSMADGSKSASAIVTLKPTGGGGTPGNNGTELTAGRFLDQAAFGPTPQEIANVQALGIPAWLDRQFTMPESAFPIPQQSGAVRQLTLNRMVTAPDQLRQKMAWALGQIIVISMNKNIYPGEYVPYQQILSRNAFGNYRTLLGEIVVSPQMGKYLDSANSNKATTGSGANENLARELMQLFTIGLQQLNLDGSVKLVNGQPVPTFTQAEVIQTAAALTGWTYPTALGAQPRSNNWEEFSQPKMETREGNHDTTLKRLVNGCVLPAGQTVQRDTDGVLDCLFNHPNIGPFLATRLIRSLVTSNPTPEYIARIATVFNDNGAGVRGDLKAMLRSILLDPEARQDTAIQAGGRLKDPVSYLIGFVRAMNGTIGPATQIAYLFNNMNQPINAPVSVFGYYSPMYRLPFDPSLFGPEFQIYSATEAIVAGNMVYQMLTQPAGDPSIDLAPFQAVAGNTAQLLDLVDRRLLYGRMPAGMRTAIAGAIDTAYDNTQRVQAAVYLTALSGQYQVQY